MGIGINTFAQNTYVPDDNFEQALIDLGYDDVLDDYVLTSNISGITVLNITGSGIHDLTGIEDFTALTSLVCSNNQLTSLDVSSNIALTYYLFCNENQLTSLDVRNCNNANLYSFNSKGNPDLECIFVDNKDAPYLNSWSIDPTSTFVETEAECNALDIENSMKETCNKIYPNPSVGVIYVNFAEEKYIKRLIISDITGRQILEKTNVQQNTAIDLSDFNTGIYIIDIQTEKGIFTSKIIKR